MAATYSALNHKTCKPVLEPVAASSLAQRRNMKKLTSTDMSWRAWHLRRWHFLQFLYVMLQGVRAFRRKCMKALLFLSGRVKKTPAPSFHRVWSVSHISKPNVGMSLPLCTWWKPKSRWGRLVCWKPVFRAIERRNQARSPLVFCKFSTTSEYIKVEMMSSCFTLNVWGFFEKYYLS